MDPLHGNRRVEAGPLTFFAPLEPLAGIGHLVMTTRAGGLSQPPYDTLNLGAHVGDVGERVRLNRRKVAAALGRKLREPVVPDQVHGTRVQAVGELHAGTRWEQPERALDGTDALITAATRLPLVVLVADCLPIAVADPVRRAGAVIHAGWRGLADGIVEATFTLMAQTWGSEAADLHVWAGPAIGPCCYEVGPEVAHRFGGFTRPGEGDRVQLDLRAALHARLGRAGVNEENITGLPLCTACQAELFFSHRRATRAGYDTTGRQALFFWLDPS